MNPTIKSLTEVIISKDDRSQRIISSGIVEIEISSIKHNLKNDARIFTVEDFLMVEIEEYFDEVLQQTVPGQTLRQRIKQADGKFFKEKTKTKEEFEGLELYFKTNFPEATFKEMVSFALLDETQTNPIYNTLEGQLTTAEQWEIKTEA